MAKRKLKLEFLVSTAPCSQWLRAINVKQLERMGLTPDSDGVIYFPQILDKARILSGGQSDNGRELIGQVIALSLSAKREVAEKLAEVLIEKNSDEKKSQDLSVNDGAVIFRNIDELISWAEDREIYRSGSALNSKIALDYEEKYGEDALEDIQTLRSFDLSLFDRYSRDNEELHVRHTKAILSMRKTTDTLKKIENYLSADQPSSNLMDVLIEELVSLSSSDILNIADLSAVTHYGGKYPARWEVEYDGAYKKSDVELSFKAGSLAMRHWNEINSTMKEHNKRPYDAISAGGSKQNPQRFVHQSWLDFKRDQVVKLT